MNRDTPGGDFRLVTDRLTLRELGEGDAEFIHILAAIKAGRFDGRIEQAARAATGEHEAVPAKPRAVDPFPDDEAADGGGLRPALAAEELGPSLDQMILDYLSAEAEQEHLVLVLDGHDEIKSGRSNHLVLRAYSSKSGLPVAGVQVAVKMLSTVSDPRTLLTAETDDVGTLEFQLDVPTIDRGSVALVISGASQLGRAEIKQLL